MRDRRQIVLAIAIPGLILSCLAQSVAGSAATLAVVTLALTQTDQSIPVKRVLIALSLVALVLIPDLSDDFRRYLVEGYATTQGISPFLNSPDDMTLLLDHPSLSMVNHPQLTAIYPPLAQSLFAVSAWISTSYLGWKIVIAIGLLALLQHDRDAFWLLISAPIVIFEGLWNGHLDVLGLIPLALLPAAVSRGRGAHAGVLLGLLVSLKTMPLIWAPLVWQAIPRRARIPLTLSCLATLTLTYLPFAGAGVHLFESFMTYSGSWSFNSAIFIGASGIVDGGRIRIAMALVLMVALIAVYFAKGSLTWKMRASWIAMVVMSPTFYPWYLLWLVPLCRGANRAWLNAAYLVSFLSYWTLVEFRTSGDWRESWAWMLPEWMLLAICFWMISRRDEEPT